MEMTEPLEVVRLALERLGPALDEFERTGPPPTGSLEAMEYDSLLRHQADLLVHQELLAGAADLEVSLVGGAESQNKVEASFLGEFLERLQSGLLSVLQVIEGGEGHSRGPFSQHALGAGQLRVAATPAGSFGLSLLGPSQTVPMSVEEGVDGETEFDEAVGALFDFVDAAEAIDEVALQVAAGVLGHRALTHVEALAKALASTGTTARFTHHPVTRSTYRTTAVPPSTARRIETFLSETQQETRRVEYEGRLVGASWVSRTFQLQLDEEVTLKGSVTVDLRSAVAHRFDQVVRAVVEETVTSSSLDDEVTTSYRLIELRRPEGGN